MTKNNTVITFDLHEVIFTFDYKKIAKILWNAKHKWTIFATIFRLPLVWKLMKMVWQDATDEEFYELFEQQRPILLPLIIEMTNSQKVIPGMDTVIEELAERGHTLHIFSNIGPRRFKQLSIDFPQIMRHFKKAKIVQPGQKPSIKKPDIQFFREYLTDYIKPDQKVIFIDDNKKNIEVARSLGMTAIPFTSAKKLYTQLKKHGVLS